MYNELQKKSKVCNPHPNIIHISHSCFDSKRPSDSSRSVPIPILEPSPQWRKVLFEEVGELLLLTNLEKEVSKTLAGDLVRQKDFDIVKPSRKNDGGFGYIKTS